MKKLFITGGAGFIGSHTVDLALQKGYEVIVYDIKTWEDAVNLHHVKDKVHYIEGDILDYEFLKSSMETGTRVLHLAAIVSVPETIKNPLYSHNVNVTGTLHVFEAAKEKGIERIVYASSAAVYGDQTKYPVSENSQAQPQSPYGLHKLINDEYAALANGVEGRSLLGLRYFNVFGTRQDPASPYSGVISIFYEAARTGNPITIFGDGSVTRDFISVKDVAHANLVAIESNQSGVCNIGRGEEVSITELVKTIESVFGSQIEKQYKPSREGDIARSCADVKIANEVLGFQSNLTLEEGLKMML